MRMAERALGRRRARHRRWRPRKTAARTEQARQARTAAKRALAERGALYYALRAVTMAMMLDVWIFGRVRTGPFFVLLERSEVAS